MKSSSQSAHRRLAAIVHADIAGFSALMGANEDGTHAAVQAAMKRCAELVARHKGRIVSTAGDAFLAEFPSIVQAIEASKAIQSPDHDAPANPEAPTIRFRIGVNIGDIITDEKDIFGDGVNVAARVQAIAPPGGIAITGAAYDQLGNRLDIAFKDSGERQLKNIDRPVRVYISKPPFVAPGEDPGARKARTRPQKFRVHRVLVMGCATIAVVALAIFGVGRNHEWPPEESGEVLYASNRPVLAVLPFKAIGAAADEAYFADGFTEDIISNLGRFPELIVLSWNAVAPYGDRTVSIAQIRSDLNARYVIGGTIRHSEDNLRLSVQLTDARDGTLLWSENYAARDSDVFDLQDQIAGTAAGALALGIERVEQRTTLTQPTETMTAYDLVLRGRFAMRRVDRQANLEAQDYFRKAISLDPGYADAHAELAWTYVNEVWWGWSEWPHDTIAKGEQSARKALDIAPDNVTALSALSEMHWMKNEFPSAQRFCASAVEQNPNDARAHASCAGVMTFSGLIDEGIAHGELTLRLDPEPSSWLYTNLAIAYYFRDRFADAARVLSRSASFIDEDPAPHAVLAAVYARLGEVALARREMEKTIKLFPFFDAKIFAANLSSTGRSEDLLEGLYAAGFE